MKKDEIVHILEQAKRNEHVYAHNRELFNIYEGDLLTYVLIALRAMLSPKAFETIQHRVSPINVLRRMIDKLSKIYVKEPIRKITPDSEQNQSLYTFYNESINRNKVFGEANSFFNLFKNTLIEPYMHNGVPCARTIPSSQFFVYSNNSINPTEPTHYMKFMGEVNEGAQAKKIFWLYTDEEFLIVDEKGDIQMDQMKAYGVEDGKNTYGKAPFVYINKSSHRLIPTVDTDTLAMTKIVAILLSDINFATMMQSFSVIYGIDITFENLEMNPNALWSFKSDANSGKNPQIGSIKPEVDTDKVIALIAAQISLWFQSKNIKAGGIDQLTTGNFASGIAKAIDEIDTSEDRAMQTPFFKVAEEQFDDLIINHMHPVWSQDKSFKGKGQFEKGSKTTITFPEQKPMVDSSVVQKDAITRWEKGFIPKKKALAEMYPEASDEELTSWLDEAISENEAALKSYKEPSPTPTTENIPEDQAPGATEVYQ